MWLSKLVILTVWFKVTLGARILGIFPTPSVSHQVVFHALTHELAQRGHELVILTTDPANLHQNITEIDVHDVSYPLWESDFMGKVMNDERNGQRSTVNMYRTYLKFNEVLFETQMSLPEVRALLKYKSDYFDLILVESLFRLAFAFRHKFQVPLISVSSLAGFIYNYDSMGVPSHPVLYPDFMSTRVGHFTLMEKLEALHLHISKYYYDWYYMKRYNKVTKKYFGADTPDLAVIESQTDMMFLNVNPIWNGIRPTPPSVIYMWGTHLKPEKELPLDLKKILDSSKRGIVYMSLGTNIKSTDLTEDRLRVFLEAFRHLPYDVLWKYEAETLPGRSDNVHIYKWFPQADLLRHQNIKAFITQGGLQSTDEALYSGVPLVGIPFFADQEGNVAKFAQHGVGVNLDIRTLTADQLKDAIINVAESEKYRLAVRRMSRLLTDGVDGGPGVSRAAHWVEYVLRHGGAGHLRSPSAGVSFSEYIMLDVFAALALSIAVLILALVATIRFLYNKLKFYFRYKSELKRHKD